MRGGWLVPAVLLGVAGVVTAQPDTTPPSIPGTPNVILRSADATGATFTITWSASLDPPAQTPVPTYRYTAGFGDGQAVTSGTVTTPSLTLVLPYHTSGTAQAGFVCIQAIDAAGNASVDQACNAVPVPAPPLTSPPPTTARNVVTWQDNSTNETSFRVERQSGVGLGMGPFAPLATVDANVTTFTDTAVQEGTTYCYRVLASNAAGDSAFSNTACRTVLAAGVLPSAPPNLVVTPGL